MADVLERDKRKASYRYSWKKPWLFWDFHDMRTYRTEREVYRKIGLIERHSRFKKPYLNPREHQWGELIFSGPGWYPPPGDSGGDVGFCSMACNGGIILCSGGCDTITCICGNYPFTGIILVDPTGRAYIQGGESLTDPLLVCLPDTPDLKLDYPVIIVQVIDAYGQVTITEHPVLQCDGCCDEFELTGDETVNPGDLWTGTVDPACNFTECSIQSNSECELSCAMSGNGKEVYVNVPADACGSFTVTVQSTEDECPVLSASIEVRINNTGQGGAWTLIDSWTGTQGTCGAPGGCSADPLRTCTVGYTQNCTSGKYRMGSDASPAGNASCWCCFACESCDPTTGEPDIDCKTICQSCASSRWCGSCTGIFRGTIFAAGLWEWKCAC